MQIPCLRFCRGCLNGSRAADCLLLEVAPTFLHAFDLFDRGRRRVGRSHSVEQPFLEQSIDQRPRLASRPHATNKPVQGRITGVLGSNPPGSLKRGRASLSVGACAARSSATIELFSFPARPPGGILDSQNWFTRGTDLQRVAGRIRRRAGNAGCP
jgi:hypothetical protein